MVPSTTSLGGWGSVGFEVGRFFALRYRMPSEASENDFIFGSRLCLPTLSMPVQESPIIFDYVKLYLMNRVTLGSFHCLTIVSCGGLLNYVNGVYYESIIKCICRGCRWLRA